MQELSKIFWSFVALSIINFYLDMIFASVFSLTFAGLAFIAQATVRAIKKELGN